jgi:hypothetical protein
VIAHSHAERQRRPRVVRRPVAASRNRIETIIGEITDVDSLRLVRHGAHTVWGLLNRTAATLLAHTWLRLAWVCSHNTRLRQLPGPLSRLISAPTPIAT